MALAASLALTDFMRVPNLDWQAGDVAARDVRAPFPFRYVDETTTAARREGAAAAIPQVYKHDAQAASELQSRVSSAFDAGRQRWASTEAAAIASGQDGLSPESVDALTEAFIRQVGLDLDTGEVRIFAETGFHQDSEQRVNELIAHAMSGFVVGSRSVLPASPPVDVLSKTGKQERRLDSFEGILTAEDAGKEVYIYALQHMEEVAPLSLRAEKAVAQAAIHGNLTSAPQITAERRRSATAAVPEVVVSVERGTALIRQGDVVTPHHVEQLQAMQQAHAGSNPLLVTGSLFTFCLLLMSSIYWFSRSYIKKFSSANRQIEATGLLLVLTLFLARAVLSLSDTMASAGEIPAHSMWYLLPLAGAALLVRILINSETSLVFAIIASSLSALLMEQSVLYGVFFVVSSVTAAGAIGKSRERKAILRAGLITGLVNAAFVLVIQLIEANLGEGGLQQSSPIWAVGFAFAGGVLSSFLVLALVPLFELVGFDTDLKLLELANLDHPLLRNLMLRAPGSYHHSVMVGTLAEAAAEAIGANALQARVASYFHDIGKAVRPQYFIENQRDGINRHERLTPHQSARVIIDHVRDGGAIARKHKLPRVIVDNIYMHHGTGTVHYFLRQAQMSAEGAVDPADFRYPGPKPNTREAGVIMLADKIEAACRSIKEPTPERVAEMIQRIINSVMAEGQFDECPLTVKELHTIAGVFKKTVLAIHHHRIEYPDPPAAGEKRVPQPPEGSPDPVITLELNTGDLDLPDDEDTGSLPELPEEVAAMADYESPEYLPELGRDR
ncbi:MAG: HDIG domain-containing metalloprotein [Myxococcota bacterium]|nr:HDIG domain-containing metalloprotein [Myxococcota bacterium]